MWEAVRQLSMKIAASTVGRFLDLFLRGVSEDALRAFLDTADAYRHWLLVNEFDLSLQNELADRLHARAHAMHAPIAVKPFAYGGEVLVMTPLGVFRDAFLDEATRFRHD